MEDCLSPTLTIMLLQYTCRSLPLINCFSSSESGWSHFNEMARAPFPMKAKNMFISILLIVISNEKHTSVALDRLTEVCTDKLRLVVALALACNYFLGHFAWVYNQEWFITYYLLLLLITYYISYQSRSPPKQ